MPNTGQLNIYGKVDLNTNRTSQWVYIEIDTLDRLDFLDLWPGCVIKIEIDGRMTVFQVKRRDYRRMKVWVERIYDH